MEWNKLRHNKDVVFHKGILPDIQTSNLAKTTEKNCIIVNWGLIFDVSSVLRVQYTYAGEVQYEK